MLKLVVVGRGRGCRVDPDQSSGDVVNATVRRWQLTETLRQLRENAGLTIEQTAEQLRAAGTGKWSRSKLGRVETREQGVKPREVEQLLDLYQVTDANLRAWLLDLAATAHERGYWRAIRKDLPEDFHDFLNVEAALVALRQFETMLIPGLLQTPDFNRALINGASPGISPDLAQRRVMARITRQQVLTRENPLQYHVILDEAILERQVGSPVITRNQLQRLMSYVRAGWWGRRSPIGLRCSQSTRHALTPPDTNTAEKCRLTCTEQPKAAPCDPH